MIYDHKCRSEAVSHRWTNVDQVCLCSGSGRVSDSRNLKFWGKNVTETIPCPACQKSAVKESFSSISVA